MEAILKNPEHPEYGTAAIPVPFSIVAEEYEESMRRLAAMGIGDPLARDCALHCYITLDYPAFYYIHLHMRHIKKSYHALTRPMIDICYLLKTTILS